MTRRIALGGLALAAVACLTAVSRGAASGTTRPGTLPYYSDRDFTPHWSPVGHRVGPIALRDQAGAPFGSAQLRGRIHVASFVFTTCPSVCPTLVQRLMAVQRAARQWTDVLLVSYSVTPAIDTPGVLAGFGRARGIDPSRWKLLTGDRAQIGRLLRESYFADDDRLDRPGGAARLLHSEKVLLVDREGRLRGVYDGTLAIEIEHLLEDIARLRTGAATDRARSG